MLLFTLKAKEWKTKIEESGIAKEIKKVVPSRCRLGNDFCEASCHAIGRVTGSCNEDFTDCTCEDEKVSAKQYALCLKEGVCSVCCQRQGYGSGECRGSNGWDCKCISNDDRGDEIETDVNTDDYDFDDFDVSEFDVRNGGFPAEDFTK